MIYRHQDYRKYLRDHLNQTIQRRPGYSMRSFAAQLGLSPSALSEVLNGRKHISVERARTLAAKLKLDSKAQRYFQLLVELEKTSSMDTKQAIVQELQEIAPKEREFQSLDLEKFHLISNWIHFALLEFLNLPGEFCVRQASRRLGIHIKQVEEALDRLERLDLLQNINGKWCPTQSNVQVQSDQKNQALSLFYRETLQKAAVALEKQNPDQRISGSETLSFDRGQIDEARELIHQCLDQLVALARQSKSTSDVYHMSIHFFNLTPKV